MTYFQKLLQKKVRDQVQGQVTQVNRQVCRQAGDLARLQIYKQVWDQVDSNGQVRRQVLGQLRNSL
jgi:hypothetical protein